MRERNAAAAEAAKTSAPDLSSPMETPPEVAAASTVNRQSPIRP